MRARNYCYTLNNYTDDEIENLKKWKNEYHVFGLEIGKEGTMHVQGYIEFKNAATFESIKKKFPRIHLEVRKGTAKQAADYCKKEASEIFEEGAISMQGKRTDIAICAEAITDGANMREIAREYPVQFVKFHKGFKALKAELIEPRNEVPSVRVFWGATGTGKSKIARESLNFDEKWVWTPQRKHWFDGYQGEKSVIFEEFRGQLPMGMVLSLWDRYDCPVEYKGGTIEFCATDIIVTSPSHPIDWYENMGDDRIEQLMRRITSIEKLGEPDTAAEIDRRNRRLKDDFW